MELGSIFLILAVLIAVGIYLYAPLAERVQSVDIKESHESSALQAERDRVINSLQELDFDFKLGKVPAEDYPEQRANLLQKGADILRKLDEVNVNMSPISKSEIDDEKIEMMIKARRKEIKSKSAGFCPKCGKPVLVTDKFCPACGANLK